MYQDGQKKRLAQVLIWGCAIVTGGIGVVGYALPKLRAEQHRSDCAEQLIRLGLMCRMYVSESKGNRYPNLSTEAGRLSVLRHEVYPEYLPDEQFLVCPGDSSTLSKRYQAENDPTWYFDDHSYWYLGAGVWNDESGRNYIEAYKKRLEDPVKNAFEKVGNSNWHHSSDDLTSILVLLESCNHFIIGDPGGVIRESEIPLLIERPGNHADGAHVQFLDGHVEFMAYPGKFPMTEEFITALQELDTLEKTD